MKKVIALLLIGGFMMGCDTNAAPTSDQQAEVKAIAKIAQFEGFREDWYSCSAGIRTIGYGFTESVLTEAEKKLTSMDRKTADRILGREVRKIQKQVKGLVKRELTVGQQVALISFVYNFGLPKFKSSTLLKRINDGSNDDVIAKEFGRWVYGGLYKKDKNGRLVLDANGKKIPVPLKGLVKRRAAEVSYWCA